MFPRSFWGVSGLSRRFQGLSRSFEGASEAFKFRGWDDVSEVFPRVLDGFRGVPGDVFLI